MIFGLLSLLFKLFEKTAILILLNDYLLRKHPKIHSEIIISLAYNAIYVYSYCQIKCKKCLSYIEKNCPLVLKNYLIKMLENSENNISTIEFIKDNKLVYFSTKSILKEINFEVPDYDFIIYRDNNAMPTNIKYISYKTKDELKNEEIYEYEKSNVKFMVIEFSINEKTYLVELSNNKYNFYIKDNIFNKQFFMYYLRYFYCNKNNFEKTDENDLRIDDMDIKLDDMDEITLKIIDHNVDIKKIEFTKDSNQYIRLDKDTYEITSK
jgi:hypothetical protein